MSISNRYAVPGILDVFSGVIKTVVGVVVVLPDQAAKLIIDPNPGVSLTIFIGEDFTGLIAVLVVIISVSLDIWGQYTDIRGQHADLPCLKFIHDLLGAIITL
jgi:hypothetical protein